MLRQCGPHKQHAHKNYANTKDRHAFYDIRPGNGAGSILTMEPARVASEMKFEAQILHAGTFARLSIG